MNRVSLCLLIVLTLLATVLPSAAQAGFLDADTMKAALNTATPQEEGFVQHVIDMVDSGALPLDLVQSTFLWAKKKPHKKFYYFKQGLILRASQRGIKI